jgi:predicted DNA-binding transcriptional regulator YafY
MNKWEKIVEIDRLLSQSRYCIPLTRMLDTLDCSKATFHRLQAFMQQSLGAPIIYDKQYKGYHYDPQAPRFELPGLWLTKPEIEALLSFEQAVQSLQSGLFAELFAPFRNKIESLLTTQKISPALFNDRIKFISIASRPCEPAIFRSIAAAVLHKKNLTIEHHPLTHQSPVRRIVSPQALVRYKDNWYLDAFCHLRQELRTFAMDRITLAENARGKFVKVTKARLEAFYGKSYGIFTGPAVNVATIRFTGLAAREVAAQSWHPQQKGRWIDATTYQLSVPYGQSRELVMDILRWGAEAEVVGPGELRQEMRRKAGELHEVYKKKLGGRTI